MSTQTNVRPLDRDWFEIAKMFERMGVIELAGSKHHPLILWFHSQTSLRATTDEVPWCSSFACACMEMAGIPSPRSAAARDWLKWGCEIEKPSPGCVVVFDRADASNKNAAHVAFYWGDRADGRVDVLGGNQSNKVCVAPYLKSDIIAYRWPLILT